MALLASLALLSALAVVVLVALPGAGRDFVPGTASAASAVRATTSSGPAGSKVGRDIDAAALAACRAEYEAVEAAVAYYQAENGERPASVGSLRSWLRGSVSSPYFSIAIDPRRPGLVEVGAQGHPLSPGDGNCLYAR